MPFEFLVPKIKSGIIASVTHEMGDPDWYSHELERIKNHDPIIVNYIDSQDDVDCKIAALLVYLIIESQMNSDQMDADFGEIKRAIKQKSITLYADGEGYKVLNTKNLIVPGPGTMVSEEEVLRFLKRTDTDVFLVKV